MPVENVIIGTVAALAGSAIGAMAPILSNYVLQAGLIRRELLTHQINEREALYSDFIREASSLHAHSLTHDLEDAEKAVNLYALVARMRLLSSTAVVESAERFGRQIMVQYGERNITVQELRAAALQSKFDPLQDFSLACRKELQDLFERGKHTVHR